ncbi:MAG: drug/metabolite exporter YedA [Polyangiales bacterium]
MASPPREAAAAPCAEPGQPVQNPTLRPPAPAKGPLPYVALGIVYVVWGSTYLGIRVAVETIPPLLMAGARFLLAGVIVFTIAVLTGDRAGDRIRAVHWRSAAIIGSLLLLGGNGMVGVAETRLPSGIAALVVATVPLWFTGLDRLLYKARVSLAAAAGMLLGLVGVVVLVKPTSSAHLDLAGLAVLVVATASWALGSLYSREAQLPRRAFVASGMEMVAGGAVAIVAGLVTGEVGSFHPSQVSSRSLVALAYLIVAGSLLAYTAYQHALHTLPTSTVATYAYVNPVIAVGLGAALLGEPVDATTLVAAAIMLAGVAVVLRHPSRRTA